MSTVRANLTETGNLARYSDTATIVMTRNKVAFVVVSHEWYLKAKGLMEKEGE